jgi:hypothetical protein
MNWTTLLIKAGFLFIDLYKDKNEDKIKSKASFANWLNASNDSIIESVKAVREDAEVRRQLEEMGKGPKPPA